METKLQGAGGLPVSILDLAPIVQGSDAGLALRNSLDLARHAERWGYRRFWLAEHHNMTGIASSATAVAIGYVAGGTSTIRVGSGGVMLPNHAPLLVAEQFGTLASLYPGRIDLGLGRAPGTDPVTTLALRRGPSSADSFPDDVVELQGYFRPAEPGQAVRAVPGEGLEVPLWILGSSTFGARLAAALGLPYAFASHFAPDALLAALDDYRREFRPSEQLDRPYAMAAMNVIAADTDDEARRLFTSLQQQFLALRRGMPGQLAPPIDDLSEIASPPERAALAHTLAYSAVGAPSRVQEAIDVFVRETKVDELMISAHVFDHEARLRSVELTAGICASIAC
ncbi:MAG TPA: LLM class flavin-dependent oxidoreductase [Vulgatibacter sp.]